MRIAFVTTFAASKKEPLADLAARVRQGFLDAGAVPPGAEPVIRFSFTDSFLENAVSSVDRVLKRHPEMERFVAVLPGKIGPDAKTRQLTNTVNDPNIAEPVPFETLHAIAAGVPRSYPFRTVALHFHAPVFGERLIGLPASGRSWPGVIITDNWWVSGRQRSLSAYTTVEVDGDTQKLPPLPDAVNAVLKACGKVRSTKQAPIRGADGQVFPSVAPSTMQAVRDKTNEYRARIKEIAEAAALPHDLPPASEIRKENLGVLAGPRKPALEAAFKPLGYDCKGGSGEFHLTRRTTSNLTVELYLDVGTWSHSVTAFLQVRGPGYQASVGLPVSLREPGPTQYPIGDAAQWQKIVENLAALVRELDRTFVPEIEQIAGPAPAWYQPAS